MGAFCEQPSFPSSNKDHSEAAGDIQELKESIPRSPSWGVCTRVGFGQPLSN